MYDVIFFDLDGTLTDSSPGITNSVMYALRRFGIAVENRESLYPFIGPPLLDSFQRFFGFTEEQARQAIVYYREYFSAGGLFENAVYPGVPEMLGRLQSAGRRLWIATSKPEEFARRIMEHFSLDCYFEGVCGAGMDGTRTRKDEVLRYALGLSGADPARSLMVGDREHDVFGASACGLDCLGVLYGYGSREELNAAGAKYIAAGVGDVAELILGAGS